LVQGLVQGWGRPRSGKFQVQPDGRRHDPIHAPAHRKLKRFGIGIEHLEIGQTAGIVGETHAHEALPFELARVVNPRRISWVEIRKHFRMVGTVEHDRRCDLETGGDDRQRRIVALVPEPRNLGGGFGKRPV
jgi:hypothetical protein